MLWLLASLAAALLLKGKIAAARPEPAPATPQPDAALSAPPKPSPLHPPGGKVIGLHPRLTAGFGGAPLINDDASTRPDSELGIIRDRQPLPRFTDLATRSASGIDKAAGQVIGQVLGNLGIPGSGAIGQGIGAVADALGIGDKQYSDQQLAYMYSGPGGAVNPQHVLNVQGVDGSKLLRAPDGSDVRVGGDAGPANAATAEALSQRATSVNVSDMRRSSGTLE